MIKSAKLFLIFFIISVTPLLSNADTKEDSALTGIYIKCTPSGADVYIDRIRVGKASPGFRIMGLLPDQMVTITIIKRDYNPLTFKVQLNKGLNRFENLRLKPAFGYLTLTGTPDDAEVSIDEKVVGKLGEISRFKLKSGIHTLNAERVGMEPITDISIKIFDDEHLQKNIVLKKIPDTAKPEKREAADTSKKLPVPEKHIIPAEKPEPDIIKKDEITTRKKIPSNTAIPENPAETVQENENKSDEKETQENNPVLAEILPDVPDRNIIVIHLPAEAGPKINTPETINIDTGEYVLWKNQDNRFHYIVYKPEFSLYSSYGKANLGDDEEEEEDTAKPLFASPKLNTGDSWSFRFEKPGTYSYYCFIHPLEVVGHVVVSEPETGEVAVKKRAPDASNKNAQKKDTVSRKAATHEKEPPDIGTSHLVTILLPGNSGPLINKPESVRIKPGEQIVWKNQDNRFHYIIYKPEFSLYSSYGNNNEDNEDDEEEDTAEPLFASPKLNTGDSWSFRFEKPGTYSYYCFIHPLEVVGKIIVE